MIIVFVVSYFKYVYNLFCMRFKGNPLMMVPPENADSTTDNTQNPSIFVIYKDAQAYPNYLITYQS